MDTVGSSPAEEVFETPRPVSPMSSRRRLFGFAAAACGLAYLFYGPHVPHDQHLRLHVGTGSSRIVSARARLSGVREGVREDAHEARTGADWERETAWTFEHGAPASIDWSFQGANGPARIEVELDTRTESTSHTYAVDLTGGEVRVDVADLVRGLP